MNVCVSKGNNVCLHPGAFANPRKEEETVIWDYGPRSLPTSGVFSSLGGFSAERLTWFATHSTYIGAVYKHLSVNVGIDCTSHHTDIMQQFDLVIAVI